MTLDIGTRLKLIREEHGLSQRLLAKQAGVTNATISLIESGKSNPSVGNLKRVLDGFPLSLAEFFAMEDPVHEEEEKVFFPAGELAEIGKGKISYRQVGHDLKGKALQILHERFQPGADSGIIPLHHEAEEGGIIISGRLEVTVGKSKRVLAAGDAYYFDSRKPHRFKTVGDEECVFVSVCTPPSV